MAGPDITKLGLCMDRGHKPMRLLIVDKLMTHIETPYELPPQPNAPNAKLEVVACARCGLIYWGVTK